MTDNASLHLPELLANGSDPVRVKAHYEDCSHCQATFHLDDLHSLGASDEIREIHVAICDECQREVSALGLPVQSPPAGVADRVPFAVMEFVPHEDLKITLQDVGVNREALPHLIRQICESVRSLHQNNVIHLDIKPANILLQYHPLAPGEFTVKVTDFGLRAFTWTYAAPEIRNGQGPFTKAADVYSLGVTFFEIITGQPYEDMSAKQMRRRLMRSKFGYQYADVIEKCLQPKPEDRYADATELDRALNALNVPPWLPWPLVPLPWPVLFAVVLCVVAIVARTVQPPVRITAAESESPVSMLTLHEPDNVTPYEAPEVYESTNEAQSVRAQLLKEAWDALEKARQARLDRSEDSGASRYEEARTNALEVIRLAKADAIRLQRELELADIQVNPRKITDDKRDMLFSWGFLPDVGAAYVIYGEASHWLQEEEMAAYAYNEGKTLTYAFVYDVPDKSFWNAGTKCSDSLKDVPVATETLDVLRDAALNPSSPSWSTWSWSLFPMASLVGLTVCLAIAIAGNWGWIAARFPKLPQHAVHDAIRTTQIAAPPNPPELSPGALNDPFTLGIAKEGAEIGDFTIVSHIASGGLGHVYEARNLDREPVALKFLKHNYSYGADAHSGAIRDNFVEQTREMIRVRALAVRVAHVKSLWEFQVGNPSSARRA